MIKKSSRKSYRIFDRKSNGKIDRKSDRKSNLKILSREQAMQKVTRYNQNDRIMFQKKD